MPDGLQPFLFAYVTAIRPFLFLATARIRAVLRAVLRILGGKRIRRSRRNHLRTTFKFLYDDDFTYEGDTPLAIMERAIQKLEIRGNLTSSGGNKRLMSAKPTKVRSERAGWLAESQQELPSNVFLPPKTR